MKKILIALVLISTLTSCSKHFIQIYDIASKNTQIKDDSFVYENDTVKITYSFWASKGLISFNVYNKLNTPIYIDWKNSSFIYNDHKLNYWIDENLLGGVAPNSTNFSYDGPLNKIKTTLNEGAPVYSSSMVTLERVTFIPPKSYYERSQFYLIPVGQCELKTDCPVASVPRNDKPTKMTSVYGYDYTAADSPLRFRNYLAISTSINSQQFSYIDNAFYLSAVKEMDVRHYKGKGIIKADGSIGNEFPYKKNTSFFINLDSYYYSVEIRK